MLNKKIFSIKVINFKYFELFCYYIHNLQTFFEVRLVNSRSIIIQYKIGAALSSLWKLHLSLFIYLLIYSFHIWGCDWHHDYAWLTLISVATTSTLWENACMGMLCLDEPFIYIYGKGVAISLLSVKWLCWKYHKHFFFF